MILNFDKIQELVKLRAAWDEASEAEYKAQEAMLEAEGTPSEAAAKATWLAAGEVTEKAREALEEARLCAMVSAIKEALEAASVHFTVERHSFTLYEKTSYPEVVPGAIFRFPGHDNFVLEAHEIVDEEEEAWRYSFGEGVEFCRNGKAYDYWFIDHDLDELVNMVVDGLANGEKSERGAN